MSIQSNYLRERAAADRQEAEATPLPLVKARLLHSADRFEAMAERQESVDLQVEARERDKRRSRP